MKKIIAIVLFVVIVFSLCSCDFRGYDFVDTKYHFNRAIIKMPDNTIIEVQIAKWADAEDGEQITITTKDGKRYLVNSVNCILIKDEV